MILCVGSTGLLGREVVRELTGRAQAVRCFVRQGADDTALKKMGAEIAVGDVRQPESLRVALEGVETVVSSFATNIAADPSVTGLWRTDYEGNCALIDLAKREGVRKFLYVSYWGLAKFGDFEHGRIKKLVEDLLIASGIDYTVFRVTTLATDMSMLLGENLKKRGWSVLVMKPHERIRPVLLDDLAWCMAEAIDNHKAANRVIEIGGDEEYTFVEFEQLFREAIGRKVRFIFIPPEIE